MPSTEDNLRSWGDASKWVEGGDDWSAVWGSAEAQWFGCLYPRVRGFLPTGTVLEIAPGHGRWTQFLVQSCDRLVGVDIAPSAIEVCRQRFADLPKAEFHVNDGRSLSAVADMSVDLAFSFDSLVHVEADVLAGYLAELATKLTETGVAFLHHSNLGAFGRLFDVFGRVPPPVRGPLLARGIIDQRHLRAASVSATWFVAACGDVGLRCVGQELVNWGTKRTIDCISVVTRPGAPLDRANRVVANPRFMDEATSIRLASSVHAPQSSVAD